MKTKTIKALALVCAVIMPTLNARAQQEVVVVEDVAEVGDVPCKTRYYVEAPQNWFMQIGAGVAVPFFEGRSVSGDRESHFTVNYNLGVGKWFSPYMAWRLAFNGGPLHYENRGMSKMKYVGANVDFMWDMFNTFGGVNAERVFSIVPFVGFGGTYSWDYEGAENVVGRNGGVKHNTWTMPVSGGIQLRFRLCKYADFFAEGRAAFYGDNFNNIAYGRPLDINVTVNGGFAITFGGRDYNTFNPCDNLGYVKRLNSQVNALRADLAATAAALAVAQSQLPCPEVVEAEVVEVVPPLMASVRFDINSAKISDIEQVNVYNVAQWLKSNPDQTVVISGYADKDTGSEEYNKTLSQQRAEAVYNSLVNDYGIAAKRLTIQAEGSSSQPYTQNNWNRIVIFTAE